MGDLDHYLTALVASWHGLLDRWPGADVVERDGWVASRCPDPVLTNGVLTAPEALPGLLDHLAGRPRWAVWTLDRATDRAVERAGLVREEVTVPMVVGLAGRAGAEADLAADVAAAAVLRDGDAPTLAELNGLAADFFAPAVGMRVYLTPEGDSGLAILGAPPHANVSMVFTRAERRGRGLATRLLGAALDDLAANGYETASLQATASGQGVYARLGFEPVGRIHEWVSTRRAGHPEAPAGSTEVPADS